MELKIDGYIQGFTFKVENIGGTVVERKEGIEQMGSKTKLQNIDLWQRTKNSKTKTKWRLSN